MVNTKPKRKHFQYSRVCSLTLLIMKISVVAFMFLLLVASISLSVSDASGFESSICCQNYSTKRIPKHRVKRFFYTSGTCRLPSLVFMLRNDMLACVNPGQKWVMDIVRSLEEE